VISDDNPVTASGVVLYSLEEGKVKFLLLQSARHQTWGFAKGHVDSNETLMQCALREVSEETGYNLTTDDVFEVFNDCATYLLPGTSTLKRTVMFLATKPVATSGLRISGEHQQFKWCDLSAALKLLGHQQSKTCLLRASDWVENN
jgi:8-oxo-dGTP pyrophosphatase MutT (NUDIX family)